MSFSTRGKKTSTIDAGKKLPPDTKLKITLGGDEKVTEVPFKFENFPLPVEKAKKKKAARKSSKARRKRSKRTRGPLNKPQKTKP